MVWCGVVCDLGVGCEEDTGFDADSSKEDVGSGVSQIVSIDSLVVKEAV